MRDVLRVGLAVACLVNAIHAAEKPQLALLAAAKRGDAAEVQRLLDAGAEVDAKSEYGATALHFAADKGHVEIVQALLAHKADPNAKDAFYKFSPLIWATRHAAVVEALLNAGADANEVLVSAVAGGDLNRCRLLLEKGKLTPSTLSRALVAAKDKPALIELLEKAGAKLPEVPGTELRPDIIAALQGNYRSSAGEYELAATPDGQLIFRQENRRIAEWRATGDDTFTAAENPNITYKLERDSERITGFVASVGETSLRYSRFERTDPPPRPQLRPLEDETGPILARNWPSFRGPGASGVADSQRPPLTWDLEQGTNVCWKTPIPGLGHSCPIVWEDRIYVTSAIRADGKSELKIGAYGDVEAADDATLHSWRVYCLDKYSGRIVWEQTAHQGIPKGKRHTKASHANCTPATDGTHVVACFGSEGLYCYDRDGKQLWKRELGELDSGWFFNPEYQWGFGSSPILFQDTVIVQCDVGQGSYIAAFRLGDGAEVWRTEREEIPSWGTPTIVTGPDRVELVTAATKFARGYDPHTGTELWRLAGHSEITTPTPIFADNFIYVASGYRPTKPIYAIRPGAHGDISLQDGAVSNDFIAWSNAKDGPYMATPLVYRGHFYTIAPSGLLTCLDARTGKNIYGPKRVQGTFTASPVAADGKLYLTSEEGKVRVVQVGPEFVLLAENTLGEPCLATPAISDGLIFFRTEHHLVAFGRPGGAPTAATGGAGPIR